MRIGIDARPLQSNKITGVGLIVFNLIKYLSSKKHQIVLFYNQKPVHSFFTKNPNVKQVIIPVANRFLWEQIYLNKEIQKNKIDIYHAIWNYGIPFNIKIPAVLTIHDVIPLVMNDYYQSIKAKLISRNIYYLSLYITINKAKKIITVSNSSRKDVLNKFKIKANKIKTVYNGFEKNNKHIDINDLKKKYKISKEYLIYVGGLEKRKNIPIIFKAYQLLENKNNLQLVIVGENNLYINELMTSIKDLNLNSKNVIFTGYVSEEEKSTLLANAEMLIYPSLYEGFGLPPLEAMANKCPVIASNIPSISEICKDAAVLVDPHNIREITKSIDKLLNDHQLKELLINKGIQRIKNFSWTTMSQEVEKIYIESL